MGRMYTGTFTGIAATAAQDLFEMLAPTDAVVVIHSWSLGQTTELGDAQEEQILLSTNRGIGSVTSGSGGGTITTQPIAAGDPAFGGTLERNNTTRLAAGSGTLVSDLEVITWNIRVPISMVYTPETRPVVTPGNRWTLEMESTPADSITLHGTITFEEIGG